MISSSRGLTHVKFSPAHLDLMHMREHERQELDRPRIEALGMNPNGVCNTYMYRGRVLCIAGYVEVWKGVLEVYIIPSIYVSGYALQFQRAVKETLAGWWINAHRMQTASVDNEETNKWMESLGFKAEGVLEKYGPTKLNYIQWAKVK